MSPYLGTIVSLEGLLRDILAITDAYVGMSTVARLLKTDKTKETILVLNRRLRLFVDTYLLQTTTQAARVNLEVLANPTPAASDYEILVGDDIQWEIMSQPRSSATNVHPRARIDSWMDDVEQTELDDVPTNEVISTEPRSTPALVIPTAGQLQDSNRNESRSAKCYYVWKNETCPIVCRHTLCAPVRVPVCIADCAGRSMCRAPQDHGCCTVWVFQHCSLCMPDICITNGPPGDMGVICADEFSKECPSGPATPGECIHDIVFSPLILLGLCIPLTWSRTIALLLKWHSMCCVTDN